MAYCTALLADNPLQTLLISVAISVGAAVIVFITALMMGLQNNVIERTLGTQAHIRIEATQQHNNFLQHLRVLMFGR